MSLRIVTAVLRGAFAASLAAVFLAVETLRRFANCGNLFAL